MTSTDRDRSNDVAEAMSYIADLERRRLLGIPSTVDPDSPTAIVRQVERQRVEQRHLATLREQEEQRQAAADAERFERIAAMTPAERATLPEKEAGWADRYAIAGERAALAARSPEDKAKAEAEAMAIADRLHATLNGTPEEQQNDRMRARAEARKREAAKATEGLSNEELRALLADREGDK